MATQETSFTANIKGVEDLVKSGTNKITSPGDFSPEGQSGERMDILDLDLSDEELLKLRDEWERKYAPYEAKMLPIFKRNLSSYLGRQKDGRVLDQDAVGPANLQFESEETFLPAAMSQNPDPLVYCDNTPEGNAIAESVKTMLEFHADQLLLRRKLAVMARQWSIYHLGVLKMGWNDRINDVSIDNRKIQDFVFDQDGYVDVFGDFSSYLGERIRVTADVLVGLFPKHEDYIMLQVAGKLGTEVTYTEWWTDDMCFVTFKDKVLEKHKNEYFNYEDDISEKDSLGIPMTKPFNHFPQAKKPYVFLSVFSLQEQPHDITGLIEQNIPNQAKITKRTEQIDDNVSQSNNSLAFSENNFNQATAKQAADAMTKGVGKVLIPSGGPMVEAIMRLQAPSLPDAAFKDLQNSEEHLRSSWGVQGISSQEPKASETARGMMMNQTRDTSRIGGGITDIIEQTVARGVFNWLVQLYCVFYDEEHFASIMGTGKATQYSTLSAKNIDRQLIVSVSPNSMKPKDDISRINMAKDMFSLGAIGPKTLLKTLDFPNPEESAGDGVLWQLDKAAYMQMNFPELMQQVQQIQMQAQQAQMQQQSTQAQPVEQPQETVSQDLAANAPLGNAA